MSTPVTSSYHQDFSGPRMKVSHTRAQNNLQPSSRNVHNSKLIRYGVCLHTLRKECMYYINQDCNQNGNSHAYPT